MLFTFNANLTKNKFMGFNTKYCVVINTGV